MPAPVPLPDSLLKFLARRPKTTAKKISAEASQRRFFRISRGKQTCVAMVYPERSPADVSRFLRLQEIYGQNGLRVPELIEALDDQVLILEDAGDLLLQRAWRLQRETACRRLLAQCADILKKLSAVPPRLIESRLDRSRLLWEMDFFLQHFLLHYPVAAYPAAKLRESLTGLVGSIEPENTFAHRDFHSRNLLLHRGEIVMVDFQDSLLAPRYYDLVSLAFDSYLDLGRARGLLLSGQEWTESERRQLRLTALQRNIKALGTFAYQTYVRRHSVYDRYIPRTLRHIQGHLRELADPEFEVLTKYFAAVSK
jgi:aminoglycoside/choline kinase family phosphotransferase